MVSFDLPEVDTKTLSDSGVVMPIRSIATGEPMFNRHGTPVTLKLLGPDSSVYRIESRQALRDHLDKLADFEKLDKNARAVREAEATEEAARRILIKMTVGWTGIVNEAGEEIGFSQEAAASLYEQFPAIREQADAFINDRVRFLRASSGN